MLGGLPDSLEHHGTALVFAIILVEQLGIPVPGFPVLLAAGAMAGRRLAGAPGLFGAALLACVIADCLWFWIGRTFGLRVLKTLCRISLEPDSCVGQTQSRFERWGVNSLLLAKFVPGLSIVAAPLAGALRVGWPRFLVLSSLGAAAWTAAGLGVGMAFSATIDSALGVLQRIGGSALLAASVALGAYVAAKWLQRRRFLAQLRMARIGVDELYDLIAAGGLPVILDVRTETARSLEPRWIPTAIHTPAGEIARRLAQIPRDREVIVYCTCPNEASAAQVARLLMRHGFQRVRPLHGGLDAWIAAGYAVDGAVAD
jgi:membrane protein DedA with SNARE-associated domain/rhodanese-related sulfurtransferase